MTELVEPVGKKLARAREAKGLSLEEAGLETRIRPQQLAALEADDYSSFASNTYARGFLLIYGKFLGVEVRGIAKQLESGNPISIAEYQYLNAYPEHEPERNAPMRREREPKIRRPSIVPLVVFFLLLGAAALGIHLYLQAERLETAQNSHSSNTIESVTPRNNAPEATTSATPTPAPNSTVPVAPRPTPVPFAAPRLEGGDRAFVIPPSSNATPTPAPSSAIVAPTAVVQPTPAPLPVVNELVVEPLKKTWIRIRRDNPDAEPIYDDVVYPKVGVLRLKGTKFFVEIREADAVTLRKNGQTIAYQPPGVTVQ